MMLKMTCIALDDEPLALTLIEKFAQSISTLDLRATFTDAAAAARYMSEHPVDLLLTDINMPDIDGLQLVRQMEGPKPMIIFITAYKEHAHEGFDLNVVDYVVKPIHPDRFRQAIDKAQELFNLRKTAEAAAHPEEDFFYVYADYRQIKIHYKNILFIEGMGDYVKIHLENQSKPIITLERMKNLEERLSCKGFKRIHRSYLIQLEKVTARQKSQVKIQETWIPVGDKYRD